MPSKEKNKSQILADGIPEKIEKVAILRGLAQISAYSGLSISQLRRYIKNGGFPAANAVDKGKYVCSKFAIDKWFLEQRIKRFKEKGWSNKKMHQTAPSPGEFNLRNLDMVKRLLSVRKLDL